MNGWIAHESSAAPGQAAVRAVLQALWFAIVPVSLAALTLRFLIPTHIEGGTGRGIGLGVRLCQEHTAPLAVGLFLLWAALLRHWRAYLPGARLLAAPARAAPTKAKARRQVVLLFAAVLIAAAAGLLVRTSMAESYRVLSASMLPTVEPQDHILVDKRAYGFRVPLSQVRLGARAPRRGDVVVFRTDKTGQRAGNLPPRLVKRVIGLPGDHVALLMGRPVINGRQASACDAGTFVYLDGASVIRGRLAVEFLEREAYLTVHEPDNLVFSGYRVGPDEVFVLGDSRGNSLDSRNWNGGRGAGVSLAAIEGRVRRRLFKVGRDGRIDWARAGQSLGREVHLPGLDVRGLQAGIERCLRDRPPVLEIPAPPAGVSAP